MLRGYRGVIVAVAGLSLIVMAMGIGAYFGALYSPYKKQYQTVSGNSDSGEEYGGPSKSLSDISGIPGPAERAIANPQPTSGEDHEKRDLAAQESMSVWAFWMMLVAVFSAIVTTIGTIFLYKQISLTREAVEDTGRATSLMKDQNALAKDTAQRQLRAYVTVDKVEIFYTDSIPTKIALAAHFTNSGATPAKDFQGKMFTIITQGEFISLPINYDPISDTVDGSVVYIGSGKKRSITDFKDPIDGKSPDEIIHGDYSIVLHGYGRYLDVFGNMHTTTFCHAITPKSRRQYAPTEFGQPSVVACRFGNSMT